GRRRGHAREGRGRAAARLAEPLGGRGTRHPERAPPGAAAARGLVPAVLGDRRQRRRAAPGRRPRGLPARARAAAVPAHRRRRRAPAPVRHRRRLPRARAVLGGRRRERPRAHRAVPGAVHRPAGCRGRGVVAAAWWRRGRRHRGARARPGEPRGRRLRDRAHVGRGAAPDPRRRRRAVRRRRRRRPARARALPRRPAALPGDDPRRRAAAALVARSRGASRRRPPPPGRGRTHGRRGRPPRTRHVRAQPPTHRGRGTGAHPLPGPARRRRAPGPCPRAARRHRRAQRGAHMKFTDGYWLTLPGVEVLRPRHVETVEVHDDALVAYAATAPLTERRHSLNLPQLTVRVDSPMDGVIGVQVEHFRGTVDRGPAFEVRTSPDPVVVKGAEAPGEHATLTAGPLTARLRTDAPWQLDFLASDRVLTSSGERGLAALQTPDGPFVREQLALGVGHHVFGLGERFGPFVKNGQSVDIWNADGGTASEQAYKNVPFYLTDAGYGVFVDHPERVAFEVGTEVVSRTQFSVAGQRLRYYVVYGPTPKEILRRYTALTGRPARVPTWSYGLWLSTSVTTDYDEATVLSFVDRMAERELPLSVFHFDCFWMRQFHWCDFVWDPATFPDPEGTLARLHERGLKVSAWINPYIAQRSHLFEEGARLGYLVRRPNGDVWQWDMWQAGMALVDFTNPDAWRWFQDKLEVLLDQG